MSRNKKTKKEIYCKKEIKSKQKMGVTNRLNISFGLPWGLRTRQKSNFIPLIKGIKYNKLMAYISFEKEKHVTAMIKYY